MPKICPIWPFWKYRRKVLTIDEDGDPDLQISIDHTSDEYFRNDGGTFVNDTASVNTTHIGNDMGATCADFDADGDLDCYATNITDPGGGR